MDSLRSAGPAILLGSALLMACGPPGNEAGEAPEWSLSTEPTLVIGNDSVPELTFGSIGGIASLAGGEIAVLDGRATEIRVFDSRGGYLRTIARRGKGPAEFTAIDWIQGFADSVLVSDALENRVTVLAGDGTVQRRTRADPDPAYRHPSLAGRLTTGHWVASRVEAMVQGRVEGLNPQDKTCGLIPPEGDGVFLELARVGTWPLVRVEAMGAAPARFRRGTICLPSGARMVLIDADSGRVRLFSEEGAEEARFELPIPPQPLTPAMVDSALRREQATAQDDAIREFWAAVFAAEPKPPFLPFVRSAVAGGDDTIWFEGFDLDRDAPRRYFVVATEGTLRGTLAAPRGFTVFEVGPDWVLGVSEDADGVERVVRYGLIRR
jgi:hypothetical protein